LIDVTRYKESKYLIIIVGIVLLLSLPTCADTLTTTDAQAQVSLGLDYLDGIGVEIDHEKAVELFTLAAEQGNADGQYYLGECYYDGDGVKLDYKKAVEWYTLAAEQGHGRAQRQLGSCYQYGNGVKKNYEKAVYWYTLAAEQGDDLAQKWLDELLSEGPFEPEEGTTEAKKDTVVEPDEGTPESQTAIAVEPDDGITSGGAVTPASAGEATAIVIMPDCKLDCWGYKWEDSRESSGKSKKNLVISEPGEYSFARNVDFPDLFPIDVRSTGVKLDGDRVRVSYIDGKPDLDLKNMEIISSDSVTAITACRNIVDSSITVEGQGLYTYGIEELYGEMNTTGITVENYSYNAYSGVYGVYMVYGTISGGKVTVGSMSSSSYPAYGVGYLSGTISGGAFVVNGGSYNSRGVHTAFDDGIVSGGACVVNGKTVPCVT
jgi:hypothetical protein